MAMESGNFSEDANFLSTPFEAPDKVTALDGEITDLNTIVILERLELEDLESSPHCTAKMPLRMPEAWMMRRIEPIDPVDYLEYYHRVN